MNFPLSLQVAGQHISMGGGDSWLAHSDAIDSTAMVTDETGAMVWDQVFGPWGQIWQQTGTRPWFVFGGLRWPVNDPLRPSATREYSSNVYRWMTPDPDNAGADVGDSQSWDMYSYAGDNPSSRNDPSGEDYKICSNDQNGSLNCTQVENEAAFQAALANPGAGITVTGNNDSGTIYGTNASGQNVQVGTYEEVAGPGSEGGGLQDQTANLLAFEGIAEAGVRGIAALAGAGVGAMRSLLMGSGGPLVQTLGLAEVGTLSADEIFARATGVVGNQSIRAASREAAEQAADKFLGPGWEPITNRATGEIAGEISADGQRIVRLTSTGKPVPYLNLENKVTGGNLHVYYPK